MGCGIGWPQPYFCSFACLSLCMSAFHLRDHSIQRGQRHYNLIGDQLFDMCFDSELTTLDLDQLIQRLESKVQLNWKIGGR